MPSGTPPIIRDHRPQRTTEFSRVLTQPNYRDHEVEVITEDPGCLDHPRKLP
jgi:hypothetical protein